MKNQDAKHLLDKYKAGTITDEERALIETWYLKLTDHEPVQVDEADMVRRLDAVWQRLPVNKHKASGIKLFVYVRIAAAVLLLCSIGLTIYFLNRNKVVNQSLVQFNKDIKPGGNKAILTLSDGKKIILSDSKNGHVAKQGEVDIAKNGAGNLVYTTSGSSHPTAVLLNTITTPRGGQYHIVLADGTSVWLNSESSITYPTFFSEKIRNVTITGEAYFEVAKNKNQPFRVKSGKQLIEVLGTRFNINAYGDEDNIKTTLLEGSVRVSAAAQKKDFVMLTPGQQSLMNAEPGFIKVTAADTRGAVAWKNGLFYFKDADIATVMREFARWYDVEVVYKGKLPSRGITGKIYRNVTASQALSILGYLNIHFMIENTSTSKKIIVTP